MNEADFSACTLGLLGAGNMAEALLRGILKAGLFSPERVVACDALPARRELFARELGVRASGSLAETAQQADLLVLCVKPQQADAALAEVRPVFRPAVHRLISIAAGLSTARLEAALPAGARVVRVMPNTPMLVGLGAAGICPGRHAGEDDLRRAEALFGAASLVVRVAEPLMDALTALSGSGPAYLFYLVEAMVEAGVAEGLSREQALKLAARTCLGAAQMLEQTGLPPEELRRRVTSPGGTTQAALASLESERVKQKLIDAIGEAARRSRELGKGERIKEKG